MATLDLWRDRSMPGSLLDDVLTMMNEFERSFTPLRSQLIEQQRDFSPACDVVESGDNYLLTFDIPGIRKEDLNIEVSGNTLMVSGERKFEHEEKEGDTHRIERRYGKFQRSFQLPEGTNTEAIQADYQDGVLKLAVPKAQTKKAVKVPIGSAGKSFLKKLTGSKDEEKKASNA